MWLNNNPSGTFFLVPYIAAVVTGWIAVLSVARVTDSTIAAVTPLHV